MLSSLKDNIANVFNAHDQAKTIEVKDVRSDKLVYEIKDSFVTFSQQLKFMMGQSDDSLKKLVTQVEKSNII